MRYEVQLQGVEGQRIAVDVTDAASEEGAAAQARRGIDETTTVLNVDPIEPDPWNLEPSRFLNAPTAEDAAAWSEVANLHAEAGVPRISQIVEAGHEQARAVAALSAYLTYHELWGEEGEPVDPKDRVHRLRLQDVTEAMRGSAPFDLVHFSPHAA